MIDYKLLSPEYISRFQGYDRAVADCQIANCGRIVVDSTYEQPIDNEYDLDEIYGLIKNIRE